MRDTGSWGRERMGKTCRKGSEAGSRVCDHRRRAVASTHGPPGETTKLPVGPVSSFLNLVKRNLDNCSHKESIRSA